MLGPISPLFHAHSERQQADDSTSGPSGHVAVALDTLIEPLYGLPFELTITAHTTLLQRAFRYGAAFTSWSSEFLFLQDYARALNGANSLPSWSRFLHLTLLAYGARLCHEMVGIEIPTPAELEKAAKDSFDTLDLEMPDLPMIQGLMVLASCFCLGGQNTRGLVYFSE